MARTAAAVTDVLHDLAGGSSVRNDSPIGRAWRDSHVVTHHVMVGPGIYEVAGRVKLGHDVTVAEL